MHQTFKYEGSLTILPPRGRVTEASQHASLVVCHLVQALMRNKCNAWIQADVRIKYKKYLTGLLSRVLSKPLWFIAFILGKKVLEKCRNYAHFTQWRMSYFWPGPLSLFKGCANLRVSKTSSAPLLGLWCFRHYRYKNNAPISPLEKKTM